jgi:hypothetical protein
VATLEGRNLLAAIPLVTGPLQDNQHVGTMIACVARNIANANTDTAILHQLGRKPNGYIALRSSAGGVLYDASDGVASWTVAQIKLRATVAGTFTFLLW